MYFFICWKEGSFLIIHFSSVNDNVLVAASVPLKKHQGIWVNILHEANRKKCHSHSKIKSRKNWTVAYFTGWIHLAWCWPPSRWTTTQSMLDVCVIAILLQHYVISTRWFARLTDVTNPLLCYLITMGNVNYFLNQFDFNLPIHDNIINHGASMCFRKGVCTWMFVKQYRCTESQNRLGERDIIRDRQITAYWHTFLLVFWPTTHLSFQCFSHTMPGRYVPFIWLVFVSLGSNDAYML